MRKGLFVFLGWLLALSAADASSVRGLIPAPAGTKVQLYSMRQHKSEALASTTIGKDSIFLLPMPANAYHGFYLLRWKGKEIEFLYDGQTISFRLLAGDKLEVIRGAQWIRYREQKQLLSQLRQKEAAIDSQLQALSSTAFGYQKIERQQKRNVRKQNRLYKSILKKNEQLWARTLAFEWQWHGRSGASLRQKFTADSLLQLIPLYDTLALYHNRWPGFMRMYFSAYAPVESKPLAPLLMQCSAQLLEKARQHPAYLLGTIDFLQWGLEQFKAPEAMQMLAREKAVYNACSNTELQNQQGAFVRRLAVGDTLSLESIKKLNQAANVALPKVQLFVFWSSECPTCLLEFDQLHRWMKHNLPNLEVLAIGIQSETKSWAVEKQGLDSWQHLLDDQAWQGEVARDWKIMQLPYFVTTNETGQITGIYNSTAALRKALEP